MKSVRKQHIRLLVGISLAALCLVAVLVGVLYQQNYKATRQQLQLAVRSQVRLIEAVARFDATHAGKERPDGAFGATLEQLQDAYRSYPGIGDTGEFVFGYFGDGQVEFVPRPTGGPIAPVPLWSDAAEPMRRALHGESGTMVGRDYRGLLVLAAYSNVSDLGIGVVAKINVAELRAPFILWGLFAGVLAVLCVLLGAVPVLRSITPLVRRLAESEDLNRVVVDTAVDGIIGLDEHGVVRSINPAGEDIFGYRAVELIGHDVGLLIPAYARGNGGEPAPTELWRQAAAGAAGGQVLTGRRRDGTEFPLELAVGESVLGGRPIFTAIARDVTERQRAEDELRANERLLETILNALPLPIALKDHEARYRVVNRTMAEQHGHTTESMRGVSNAELVHRTPEERAQAEATDRLVLERGELLDLAEVPAHMPDGSVAWRRLIKVPLRDDTGSVVGLVALAEDITQRKRNEDALRDSLQHVALLQRVAVAANEAPTTEEALSVALSAVCETAGFALGHVYLPDPQDAQVLRPSGLWSPVQGEAHAEFRAVTERTSFPSGVGLPGRVLRTGAPAWIEDLYRDDNFPRAEEVHTRGLRSGCAFPVLVGNTVVGVLEFYSEAYLPVQPGLLDVMAQVGTQLGRVVERHRAAQELQASEERFRHLIEGSLQGVFILVEDRPVFANQAYADLLGYETPEHVLAEWCFRETFPPGELEWVLQNYHARLRGEPALTYYELEYRRRDGALVWAEVNARIINWDGRRATLVATHEISERKRAEAALRASEARFRNLIEGSRQGIVIFRRARALFVNEAFARIMGYDSPEEVLALPSLEAMVAPEYLHRLQGLDATPPNGDANNDQMQLTALRRDGHRVQIETFFQAIDWQGRGAVQATVVDISDRVRLEEQLRQAQKMEAVGQLAGGVAHDFNNILQIIRGYAELAHNAVEPGHAANYLERVLKAAEGASHVIRQLLALSRREVLHPRSLDVNGLIGDLMQMVRRIIGEDIDLSVHTEAEPAVVQGDAAMLEQVLLNLCVNARDAMPRGGRLTIRTAYLGTAHVREQEPGWTQPVGSVVVSVEDTGVGIAAEDCEHIFEPFFTTKEAGKGTGLGLSMAYGIVKQHEGLMEVDSTPGAGTTFRILLPAAAGGALEAPGGSDEDAPPGGHETVLVAEDEDAVLTLVVQLLESRGYRVLMARDGEEARQLFEAHADEIDLAILDVVMPRLSGRAVYERLQARRPDLPILFSTGYTADALDPDFVRGHGFYIIRKPYRPRTLFEAVREALDKPWPPPTMAEAAAAEGGEHKTRA